MSGLMMWERDVVNDKIAPVARPTGIRRFKHEDTRPEAKDRLGKPYFWFGYDSTGNLEKLRAAFPDQAVVKIYAWQERRRIGKGVSGKGGKGGAGGKGGGKGASGKGGRSKNG